MAIVNRRAIGKLLAGIPLLAMAAPGSGKARGGEREVGRISAADRLDIIELMARYAWAYDTSNAAALADTFTADGVLEIFGRVAISSPEMVPGFLETARQMRGDHAWQHLTDHHIFRDYDGKACTVYSYYLMPQGDATGGNGTVRAMGYYVSHCVRQGGSWRFARRSVHRWNGQAPFALTG
jgi:hypothetical protein